MKAIKECPNCGSIPDNKYVYIQCPKCGLTGPWVNGGKNDDHADYKDNENAIKNWNTLWFNWKYGEDSMGPDISDEEYNKYFG